MKKFNKLKAALAMTAIAFSAFSANYILPQIGVIQVYAATEQKTGTLSQVKATLNGKPITFQAYNIGGYNFVRARDFMNQLNMYMQPITDSYIGVGIQIYPDKKPDDLTPLPKLTKAKVSVTTDNNYIYYTDGLGIAETKGFLFEDRYYYKLADYAVASDKAMEEMVRYVTTNTNVTSNNIATFYDTTSPTGIKINWNASTSTVEITTYKVDLQKIYNDAKAGGTTPTIATTTTPTTTTAPTTTAPTTTTPTPIPNITAQPELTTAPKESSILANILVDKSKSAYNADGTTVNLSNITSFYKNGFQFGQCTWYAAGRFHETTGVLVPNGVLSYDIVKMLQKINSEYPKFTVLTDTKSIKANSIAIFNGHVAFVEYVERDANGNPTWIYYTDGNGSGTNKYRPNADGAIQKCSFDNFNNSKNLNGSSKKFLGYLMLK